MGRSLWTLLCWCFSFTNTWLQKVDAILGKYSCSQENQSPGFSVEDYLLLSHLTLTGLLGDRRHWGHCGENTHENEPEDRVNPRAQALAVLCDPERETKPLGLKYRREHCSGPMLVAWWHTCGLMRAQGGQS